MVLASFLFQRVAMKGFVLVALALLLVPLSSGFAEDSQSAQLRCGKYEWMCENKEKCIEELRKCDGIEDCSDRSDEKCNGIYCDRETHFFCPSGTCIERAQVCDKAVDCFHEEDEEHCDEEEVCPEQKFRCGNGRCIPLDWKCDAVKDCADGDDESNCTLNEKCREGYYPCKNSLCLPTYKFCDGIDDCEGEDEKHCSDVKGSCSIETGHFLCKDGSKCLKRGWICDGSYQCDDRSDEGQNCGKHCNTLDIQCQQNCFETPDGPKCLCKKGYELSSDFKTCKDINECKGTKQVCDHFCENLEGTYKCSCGNGYFLQSDNSTCTTTGKALLLFSVGNFIKAKYLDDSYSWIVRRGDKKISSVAYDPKLLNVYWIENDEKVKYKNLHGNNPPKIFIHQGLKTPENLAIDWIGRNIYVADHKHILVCNLETEDCTQILKGLGKPRSLQVDLEKKYLYWSDLHSHTIERSGLDGSERKPIVRENIVWPNGLFVDNPAQRIYWVDARLQQIDSCNYNGTDRKSFPHTDSRQAYSLVVWEDRIYWTDWGKKSRREIHSCRKRDGQFWKSEYKDEEEFVNNLALYHPSMFKEATNPCENLDGIKCSHLCLSSPSEQKGYSCACPTEMLLSTDGRKCVEKDPTKPFVGIQSKMVEVHIRSYGKSVPEYKYGELDLGMIVDMDYNPRKDTVYLADSTNNAISAVNLSNVTLNKLISVKQPLSVAVDWLRDNLYWIDGLNHVVEVARTSGLFRRVLIKQIRFPTDMALDIISGYLFVSDESVLPSIHKCELNGTQCIRLVESEIRRPSSLVLDITVNPKRIYWTDREKNTIESVDVNGRNRSLNFKGLRHPMSILVGDKIIFWTELRSSNLYYAKETGKVEEINFELENISMDEWYMVLTMIGKKADLQIDPCSRNQICHQLCFSKTKKERVCGCAEDMNLDSDSFTCGIQDCPPNQRRCDDGECMASFNWCDETLDCGDGSDEKNCIHKGICTNEMFRCKDQSCIPGDKQCDGTQDCKDGSDEKPVGTCNLKTCSQDEWKCLSGQCIPSSSKCDGTKDCVDSSDEENCNLFCCKDGICIKKESVCDGQIDCKTGEDEKTCSCLLGEYRCLNGSCLDKVKLCRNEISCEEHLNLNCESDAPPEGLLHNCTSKFIPCSATLNHICIDPKSWCDGSIECPNGEDEENCSCKADEVKCAGENICIPKSWRCDDKEDCLKGSDENCRATVEDTGECASDEFKCSDGHCILSKDVCDGISNCDQGEDEHGECSKCKYNHGGCHQDCVSGPKEYHCACWEGYKLSNDGKSCEDIDECVNRISCHHLCTNKNGTFTCSCKSGYSLTEDAITCKLNNRKHPALAMIKKEYIDYMNDDLEVSTKSKLPVNFIAEAAKFIYDPKYKTLLSIDCKNGILYREFSNEWSKESLTDNRIEAAALDYTNRNLYFVEWIDVKIKRSTDKKSSRSNVMVFNLDRKLTGKVFTVHDQRITAIEYSHKIMELIVCENNDSKGRIVLRSTKSDLVLLADEKVKMCKCLAVDDYKERIFWLDTGLNKIESIDFSGHDRRTFKSKSIQAGSGLALLDYNLVWLNTRTNAVIKCLVSNLMRCDEFHFKDVLSVVNIKPTYNVSEVTRCSESSCPYMCVPYHLDAPRCICKDGYIYEDKECIPYKLFNGIKGNCEANPCKEGTCEQITETHVSCRCPKGFGGSYCEVSSLEAGGSKSKVILVIVILLAGIGLGVVAFLCYRRKRSKMLNSPYSSKFRFRNPSFVLMKDEENEISQPPTPPISRNFYTAPSSQRDNLNSNDSTIVIEPLIK